MDVTKLLGVWESESALQELESKLIYMLILIYKFKVSRYLKNTKY
jgi:hypothetical protein